MIRVLFLFFLLNFFNQALANISSTAQKKLITNQIIYEGLPCDELTSLLGGLNKIDLLWLGNKKEEENSYVLINSNNKNDYKIFYICKKNRNNFDNSKSVNKVLRDQDFIKTFDNPEDLFTYVFSITSQSSIQYIMSRLQTEKYYNIDKNTLRKSFVNSKKIKKEPAKDRVIKKEKRKKKIVKKEPVKIELNISKDKIPPELNIKKKFIVNNANYQITGEAKDAGGGKVFIKIKDGNTENFIDVKNGKFIIERFSPINEVLEIVAIDQWNNETTKTINIIVETKKKEFKFVEKLDASKIRGKDYPNKVALIIGIENYSDSPKASYANLDAKYFYEYVKRSFGIRDQNIKLLIDKDATQSNYYEALSLWLPNKIKENVTELVIFYSGHGLATPDGKELYLLAHDSKTASSLLPRTALLRSELFDEIKKLNPKSVTLFFDTCFSGTSRENETLLASAKPVMILSTDETKIPENFTIFSSSLMNQISSGYEEANHGLFSYYLMKGLEGKADKNNDKKITNGELYSYLDENVSEIASELGRQQNPSLAGNPNKVLSRY
jgi:hypothetical protein